MKKHLLLIGVILTIVLLTASAAAVSSVQVQVDGKTVEFDAFPFVSNEELMIPVRPLSETIGARVEWDAKLKIAWIHKNMMHVEIPIGKTEFYIHRDADFSGIPQTVQLKEPIRIIKGRTFLPAVTFTDNIGLTATWDENSKTLSVISEGNLSNGNVEWAGIELTDVKSMELYSIDQEKLRNCSESEIVSVIESLNRATIDPNAHIEMIAGRVLKVSLNDGRNINFHSYGSKTNVVATFQTGEESKTYHLAAPAIAEFLLQEN